MLPTGAAPPEAIRDPTAPHKVLRVVVQPGDQAPARALAQISLGRAGYNLRVATLCLSHWIKRRWPSTGPGPGSEPSPIPTHTWTWAPTHGKTPPEATTPPHLRVPSRPQGLPAHGL